MKKLDVIKDKCISCGACIYDERNEGYFTFGSDGKSEVVNPEVNEKSASLIDVCPTSAIVITENENEA